MSDLFILGGLGLIQPVFAIFLLENIAYSSVLAVGIATSIQLVTKAILQIMIGRWTDAEKGNRRELYSLISGSVIISLVPFSYIFATNISHIYIIQLFYGLGSALAFPGWMVVFSQYLRRDRLGYEWSVYSTVMSLGTAAAASLGAYIADFYSFKVLFVIVGLLSVLGTGFVVSVFKHEFIRIRHQESEESSNQQIKMSFEDSQKNK